MAKKRVLVAPLNWGLGHATRCIPVIKLLQARGHEVIIASDGDSLSLLKQEFNTLTFFELPSYGIRYSRNIPAWLYTVWRMPGLLKTIKHEHKVVETLILKHKIDLVIADNRYGCWSERIKTVFISHQVNLLMPAGLKWAGELINFLQQTLIKKFNGIWIPDSENSILSGRLTKTRLKAEFIGLLSRFDNLHNSATTNKIAVVLSGPEPQRTLLEKNLLPQVIELNLPTVFVRGMITERMGESEIDQVKIVNYLNAESLQKVIEQSSLVIARSGYSTIMDLARLNKKAVFIPTPGQPEQEYLADKFMKDGIALAVDQEKFDLADALELSTGYSGFTDVSEDNLLLKAFEKMSI